MAPPKERSAVSGYALIALAAVLWATLGPAARYALERGIHPLEVSFWRALFAGTLFGVHALATGGGRIARRDIPAFLAFALFGVTFLFSAYFQTVRLGGAALAAVLLYTAPVWVVIASALLLREPITRAKAAALGLTLAGVVLVASGAGGLNISAAAIAWGLAASFAYAAYYLFGKRYFPRYGVPTVFLYALLLGAVGLYPLVEWSPKVPMDWIVFAWLALVPTWAAYFVYGIGLGAVEAGRAATIAMLEPVVTALIAYWLWGEDLGARGYAGAVLVLAGVLVAARPARGGSPAQPRPQA